MNVILEGCDASGKSTLAAYLAKLSGRGIIPSEGPPKYPGEMNERVDRYAVLHKVIFDRHPCISQPIYGMMRHARDSISDDRISRFYASKPLFVLCRPSPDGMKNHTINEGVDSEYHLKQVEENYAKLVEAYDLWGAQHAHIVYNVGKDFHLTVNLILHAIRIGRD